VLAYKLQSLVEFRWGTDYIRLELSPEGSGTTLTLIDRIDQVGKGARDAAGWHVCLDALEEHLNGKPSSAEAGDWKSLEAKYSKQFGPEASTIGPPEKVSR
jgi:hypothetical protein